MRAGLIASPHTRNGNNYPAYHREVKKPVPKVPSSMEISANLVDKRWKIDEKKGAGSCLLLEIT